MSEQDIRNCEPFELKELIADYSIKIADLEQRKKDYTSSLNDMIKTNKKTRDLCLEVLGAKDSELARRLSTEITNLIPRSA
jgi:hypothetical protein